MSQNISPIDSNSPFGNKNNKGKKFNFSWLYLIAFLVLMGFNLFGNFIPDAKETTELEFRKEMLNKNDIKKIEPV